MKNIQSAAAAEIRRKNRSAAAAADTSDQIVSIRVSPNNYFIAFFLTAFASGFLVYLEKDVFALALFAAGALILPLLAWNDRITFDGKRIRRAGFLPRVWARLNAARCRIRISDIEQIESQALRALKRGGSVFYRYRTTVQGKGVRFAFASGGEDYRRMIRRLLPLVHENALDNRSIELRDYLAEPKETLTKASFAKIPSAEVLEQSRNEFQNPCAAPRKLRRPAKPVAEVGQADDLRRLANELRLAGYLLQSLEAFRRALVLKPADAHLIFDFARCLNSFAGSEKNEKLRRKSFAALRLAEKRAAAASGSEFPSENARLLARIGESFFQYGEAARAAAVFKRMADAGAENFRAARGSAEIALRAGKIAYVIQHFQKAERLAATAALRRWTRRETEYFSLLNHDEDYMEMEISRVNLLENLIGAKKTCLKIAVAGFPVIVCGLLADDFIADLGWAVSGLALFVWTGLLLGVNLFAARVPADFAGEE